MLSKISALSACKTRPPHALLTARSPLESARGEKIKTYGVVNRAKKRATDLAEFALSTKIITQPCRNAQTYLDISAPLDALAHKRLLI
jgi:hypothetical protein